MSDHRGDLTIDGEMAVPKEEVQYLICELVFNSLDDQQGDVFDATKQLIEIIMDEIPKEKREELGKEILEDLIIHCDDFDEVEEVLTAVYSLDKYYLIW